MTIPSNSDNINNNNNHERKHPSTNPPDAPGTTFGTSRDDDEDDSVERRQDPQPEQRQRQEGIIHSNSNPLEDNNAEPAPAAAVDDDEDSTNRVDDEEIQDLNHPPNDKSHETMEGPAAGTFGKDPTTYGTTTTAASSSSSSSAAPAAPEQPQQQSSSRLQALPLPFYCPITKQIFVDPVVALDGVSYELSALQEQTPEQQVNGNDGKSSIPAKYYPNRALKAVIDETVAYNIDDDPWMSSSSLRAGMMRLQQSMRKSLSQVLEKSVIPTTTTNDASNSAATNNNNNHNNDTSTGLDAGGDILSNSMQSSITNNNSNNNSVYRPLPEVYYCPITFNIIHDPVIDPEGNTFERVAVENWIRANGTSPITRTPCRLSELRPNRAIYDLLELEKNKNDATIHPSIRKWKEESPPLATDPELGGMHPPNGGNGSNNNNNQYPNGDPWALGGGWNGGNNNANIHISTQQQQEAERLAERRARARCAFSFVALLFTLLFFVLFFMYGGFGLLFLGILCCNYACRFSGEENRRN